MVIQILLSINKKNNFNDFIETEFIDEEIILNNIDYYYSNVVSRASKTMNDCRNEKINKKKTGTNG